MNAFFVYKPLNIWVSAPKSIVSKGKTPFTLKSSGPNLPEIIFVLSNGVALVPNEKVLFGICASRFS
jgi:hypothetical protein